jgi:hypothetical protein
MLKKMFMRFDDCECVLYLHINQYIDLFYVLQHKKRYNMLR